MTDANLAREVAALRQQLAQRSRSLEEAEARYHAVFNSALNPMSICTTDGIILDVNQAALRAIGVQIEAFIGKHLWESPWFAQNPQEAAKVETAITRHRGQYIEYESDVLSPSGERRTFQFVLRPYRSYVGADARFLVLEVHDNTAARAKAPIQDAQELPVRPAETTHA
ncbi:PAS domain-containing protein [Phenylobacterium sp. LjRoot219]|uniref:PAS domain S-box protein n=1 Tax=Phenylobacterium sp. LjRoot219 TaxID=3342283 RepID=UPI003ECD741B